LSNEEKSRAVRLELDEHRRRFINRRGALRSILARYLEMQPHEIEFRANRSGKAWLQSRGTGLSFSASHSHELAIVAVASKGRLGADIEWVRKLPDRDDLARRFFTVKEQNEIESQTAEERTQSFFRCWTRKEAFVKALGMGLHYPLDWLDVPVGPLVDDATVTVHDRSAPASGAWALRDPEMPCGYVAAIVDDDLSARVERFRWSPT
jgi:4'-phosphopantetheinyl transferase